MSELCALLSKLFGRAVVDRTGLTGRYDVRIDLQSYEPVGDGNPVAPIDTMGAMVTALQNDLGLKLESRKEDTALLVVDHAETSLRVRVQKGGRIGDAFHRARSWHRLSGGQIQQPLNRLIG